MRYRNVIIALGFLVLIVGAIDVPFEWRKTLCAASGIAVIVLGYLAGRDRRPVTPSHSSSNPSATASTALAETPKTTSIGK